MNRYRVEYKDDEVLLTQGLEVLCECSPRDDDLNRFTQWIDTYASALDKENNDDMLLALGRNMHAWLSENLPRSAGLPKEADPPLILEFQIPKRASPLQKAFLEAPWELLADAAGHWAKALDLQYAPLRRIGGSSAAPYSPSPYRLNTVFMAAAPRRVAPELNYEAEEGAILHLHRRQALEMDLFVEESGNLEQLMGLVDDKKPVDVVHISCHGNILYDPQRRAKAPCLCLEDQKGDLAQVTPREFAATFSQNRPALTFFSACKTAQAHLPQESAQNQSFQTFVQTIIAQGFPAVLGWSGSVGDSEATRFAAALYRELTYSATLESAVARARFQLFSPPDDRTPDYRSGAWHLARLYLGPKGGGALSVGKKARFDYQKEAGIKTFLGKKAKGLEVAGRREFVGRRRQIQAVLNAFEQNSAAGVLIHGPGRQGKSSLAARIANRLEHRGYTTLLIYGKKGDERFYGSRRVLNEFKTPASLETEKEIDRLLAEVAHNPAYLKAALKTLLQKHFCGRDGTCPPVLVVVDDLEKVLTPPAGKTRLHGVKPGYQASLAAIIGAFAEAATPSRLLLTSRYDFELPDAETGNLDDRLEKIPLPAMNPIEAQKQYLAKFGTLFDPRRPAAADPKRIMAACKGNPGLQDLLFNLAVSAPGSCQRALEQMEAYLARGDLPHEERVQRFLEDLALEAVFSLLSEDEFRLLGAVSLFNLPVPVAVFDGLVEAMLLTQGEYRKRLVGFGLLERHEDLVFPSQTALKLNALAGVGIKPPAEEDAVYLAGCITPALLAAWGVAAEEAVPRPRVCDEEILKFALQCGHGPALRRCAENGVREMHARFETPTAARQAKAAIALLEQKGETAPPAGLYQIASEVCHQIGEVKQAEAYIEKALRHDGPDDGDQAAVHFQLGRLLVNRGDPDRAMKCFQAAKETFTRLKRIRESAIIGGNIAHIKVSKGEMAEALKLHKEELDVYERLGDTHSKAIALGDIARIKVDQGEVAEALMLHEQMLEVFETLGDPRSKAVTLGDIARIKVSKGEVAEALKLHEQRLEVFETIGDPREKAVTLGDIARIKVSKGEVAEALKLHEQRLEVFETLGDPREKAVTIGDIARIKVDQGEVAEALMLHEQMLEVFETLGDPRSKAVTLGDIARIKVFKGEVAEALKLHEQILEVFETLGDPREKAVTLGDIARFKVSKGEVAEALKLHEQRIEVFETLGDTREKAVTQWDIARILLYNKKDAQADDVVKAYVYLDESYQTFLASGWLDGICCVGLDLGRLLLRAGQRDPAVEILERSREGFARLGRAELALQVGKLLADADLPGNP